MQCFAAFRVLAEGRGRPGIHLADALAAGAADLGERPGRRVPEMATRFGLPAAAGLGPAATSRDVHLADAVRRER